jgi:hypothetical protein
MVFSKHNLWKPPIAASLFPKRLFSMLPSTHTICLKSDAFYALVDEVVAHIDTKFNLGKENRWITGDETMTLLNIGRVTLQKYRDEGRIRFSQHDRKNILYDRSSILEFIESAVKEKF